MLILTSNALILTSNVFVLTSNMLISTFNTFVSASNTLADLSWTIRDPPFHNAFHPAFYLPKSLIYATIYGSEFIRGLADFPFLSPKMFSFGGISHGSLSD